MRWLNRSMEPSSNELKPNSMVNSMQKYQHLYKPLYKPLLAVRTASPTKLPY